jgi:hypothetical protein
VIRSRHAILLACCGIGWSTNVADCGAQSLLAALGEPKLAVGYLASFAKVAPRRELRDEVMSA